MYNNCSRSSCIQLSSREQTDYNNNILSDLLHSYSIFGNSTHWLAEQEPPHMYSIVWCKFVSWSEQFNADLSSVLFWQN